MGKLSKAQRAFLEDIVRTGRQHCIQSYRPGLALIELGYATREDAAFGGIWLLPTPAGCAALQSTQETKK